MNFVLARVLCVLGGYCFGLFETGAIIAKKNNVDLRKEGSGNIGTTNSLRVMGVKAGAITLLGDVLKCIIAMLLAMFIFRGMFPSPDNGYRLLMIYAGIGAILGHDYPFYHHFKGGKGVACTAGFMFAFDGWFTLVGLIEFFSIFFATHYVSLGSLFVYPYVLVMQIVMGQMGYFKGYDGLVVPQHYLTEMYCITLVLLCLTTFMHRENIKRLIAHNEKKTFLSSKKKAEYLASLEAKANE